MLCPICFKPANYVTECNHHFCKTCLYRWKASCPLCRRGLILTYPKTRAMSMQPYVIDSMRILLYNVDRVKESTYKLTYTEKLFQFIWEYRIVVRKYGDLCRMIRTRSAYIKSRCLLLGLSPPTILHKMAIL